jgi:hypothetical protein
MYVCIYIYIYIYIFDSLYVCVEREATRHVRMGRSPYREMIVIITIILMIIIVILMIIIQMCVYLKKYIYIYI